MNEYREISGGGKYAGKIWERVAVTDFLAGSVKKTPFSKNRPFETFCDKEKNRTLNFFRGSDGRRASLTTPGKHTKRPRPWLSINFSSFPIYISLSKGFVTEHWGTTTETFPELINHLEHPPLPALRKGNKAQSYHQTGIGAKAPTLGYI